MREVLYLVSAAGSARSADDDITGEWVGFVARARPEALLVLDCPVPAAARPLLEGLHPNLTVTDALWRASDQVSHEGLRGAWDGVRARVLLRDEALFERGAPLFRAQSIHLLSGGRLEGDWTHPVGLVAGATAARQVTGARLFGIGIGLLPESPELPELARALATVDHVSCADAWCENRAATKLDEAYTMYPSPRRDRTRIPTLATLSS